MAFVKGILLARVAALLGRGLAAQLAIAQHDPKRNNRPSMRAMIGFAGHQSQARSRNSLSLCAVYRDDAVNHQLALSRVEAHRNPRRGRLRFSCSNQRLSRSRGQRFADRCLPPGRCASQICARFRVPESHRPDMWTPAHASKASRANPLPAWLSAKRTAASGFALQARPRRHSAADFESWQGQFQGPILGTAGSRNSTPVVADAGKFPVKARLETRLYQTFFPAA